LIRFIPNHIKRDCELFIILQLDFSKIAKVAAACPDVIPVAVQNIETHEVILIAYVNELALKTSVETKTAVFWSTSRNEL
jgi:phosphoribosyl-AMP cyclohydrolase